MDNIGIITKQLLGNRIKNVQQAYKQIQESQPNHLLSYNQLQNSNFPSYNQIQQQPNLLSYDNETMNTNFGNISNIQIPYEIQSANFEYEEEPVEEEPEEKNEEKNENFCSYVLYFIIILISLGYIGFQLAKEKVISLESMNGITLGLLTGMIIVNLLWSSIKNN